MSCPPKPQRRSPTLAVSSCTTSASCSSKAERSATPPSRSSGLCGTRWGTMHAGYVHRGATSQDVIDTAAMLVSRRALDLIRESSIAWGTPRRLAEEHRSTPMAARTSSSRPFPGRSGTRRPVGSCRARGAGAGSGRCVDERLAVAARRSSWDAGGARGDGLGCVTAFAELELAEPDAAVAHEPDTHRRAGERSTCAPPCSRRSASISCCSRRRRWVRCGRGRTADRRRCPRSATPSAPVLARACAELVSGYASVLTRSVVQEHERAAGAWHAEVGGPVGSARVHRRGSVERRRGAREPRCRRPAHGAEPRADGWPDRDRARRVRARRR